MTRWSRLPGEAQELYSPIGLRLIDDFTGGLPLGLVRAQLERRDSSGGWQATDIDVIRTPNGILAYPGLGRQAEVVGQLPRRYRVTLEAEIYRPFYRILPVGLIVSSPHYRETVDGIEFDAFPYNDANSPTDYTVIPPQVIKPQAQDVRLAPAVNYPFPTHVRILRGKVVDATGKSRWLMPR